MEEDHHVAALAGMFFLVRLEAFQQHGIEAHDQVLARFVLRHCDAFTIANLLAHREGTCVEGEGVGGENHPRIKRD